MQHSYDTIKESWGTPEDGTPTYVLAIINMKVKDLLQRKNKEKVGNMFHKIEILQSKIELLKTNVVENGYTLDDFGDLQLTRKELSKVYGFKN